MSSEGASSSPFRLVDSGVADGRRQIAYDAALVELHAAGRVPDTVRFLRFPPTVLVGRHQVLAQEVHVERCHAEGVGLVRRVSGGGAIYLDEGQVGWELVFSRRTLARPTLDAYAETICTAVARGLEHAFGIPARFRPRNDIEVEGRKISGTGGFFAGNTLVYQGTMLVDMDAARMARLINIPAAKLARHGAASGASRVVTLKELIGRTPAITEVHDAILRGLRDVLAIATAVAAPSDDEMALTQRLLDEEIGTDAFVLGTDPARTEGILEARSETPGGTVTAYVRLEGSAKTRRVREAVITGDFFIAPPRAIYDLEAALRGLHLTEIGGAVDAYFGSAAIGLMSMSPVAIRDTLLAAIAKDTS